VAGFHPRHQRDIGINALTLDVVGVAHYGCFGNVNMRHERTLDLRRPKPMSRDVDHVIYTAGDPVVAVLIAATAVAGEIFAGIRLEVSVDEPLVVAEDRKSVV